MKGNSKGQDQNSEALAPSASWRGNHRRRGTLSPPFLEIHGTGGPQSRTKSTTITEPRTREGMAAAGDLLSPPPHTKPHHTEARRPTCSQKRRLQEDYGAWGIAAVQQSLDFHPGRKWAWDGEDKT